MNTNGKYNYTTNKETSKTFKRLGQLVGIKVTSKSQRGIIARKYLHQIQKEREAKILVGLNNYIDIKQTLRPIRHNGKIIDYL